MKQLRIKPGSRSMVPVELPCGDMMVLNLGLRGLMKLDAAGNAPEKIISCPNGHKSRVKYERGVAAGDETPYYLCGELVTP